MYLRGYKIKCDGKGKYPRKNDWLVREFDGVGWPSGSTPKPVPSDNYFFNFGRKDTETSISKHLQEILVMSAGKLRPTCDLW